MSDEVSRLGFTRLDPIGVLPAPTIVFVHGFRGHPQSTWGDEDHETAAEALEDAVHIFSEQSLGRYPRMFNRIAI
ncbi:hypothetical protein HYQ44_015615 [Verticillium longisporum]|nr:hypothetical protein HYQ44_015615 [Verticillium longisporum]